MNCERCGGDTMVSYSKRSRKEPVPGSSVDLIKRSVSGGAKVGRVGGGLLSNGD